jgi:hypothetical protein
MGRGDVTIVMIVDDGGKSNEAIRLLKKTTDLGIGEIVTRLKERRPILEYPLFFNDHEEVAERLRDLVSNLPRLGVSFRLFELHEDVAFALSPEGLRNILEMHEEIARQDGEEMAARMAMLDEEAADFGRKPN